MRVKVTKLAFHKGARVHPGDVISVPDGKKAKWFEPIEEPAPKPARGKKAETLEPNADSGADLI